MRLETLDMRFLLTVGFSLRATTPLSKRANLTKQYAQRTVADEPRGGSALQRGATTHPYNTGDLFEIPHSLRSFGMTPCHSPPLAGGGRWKYLFRHQVAVRAGVVQS
jgi:hypothetical protein